MSDAIGELSGKLGLDTTDFKTAVVGANRELRVLESQFRANSAALGDWAKDATGLEMRIKSLTSQMDIQRAKVAALRQEHQRVAADQGANSRAAQDLEIKLNRETEALGKMQVELGDSKNALEKMGKGSQDAGKEVDDLGKKEEHAGSSTEGLSKAFEKMGKMAKDVAGGMASLAGKVANLAAEVAKAAAALVAGAVAGSAALLATTVGPASDLNETVSKTQVVFGDAADQVLAFGAKSATALGMSKNAALTAAGTYGNLFVSMGMTADKSADMSMGLVQLAGDLASFNNMSPEDVLEKLRAGLTGETEPLKSLGVNLNAAAVEAKAMEMGLISAGGELTAAAKAQATYALVLEQTKTAQGDFARTSDGLANQQRILTAQIENARATIGTGLLPVLAAGAQALTSFLASDRVQSGLQALSDGLAGFGRMLTGIFNGNQAGAIAGVVDAFMKFGSIFGVSAVAAAGFGKTVGETITGLIQAFKVGFGSDGDIVTGVSNALYSLDGLSPIFDTLGDTVNTVAGYVRSLFAIFRGSGGDIGTLGTGLGKLLAQILSDTASARAGMVKAAIGILQGLSTGLITALPSLLPVAMQVVQSLLSFLTQSLPRLVESGLLVVNTLVSGIVTALPALLATGVQILMSVINGIVPMLPMLIDTALQLVVTLVDGIAKALPALIPVIVTIIPEIVLILLKNLPLLIQAALKLILAFAQGLVAAIPELLPYVPQIVRAVFDTLIASLPLIGSAGLQLIGTLASGIIGALPSLGTAVGQIISAITTGLAGVGKTLYSVGEQIVTGIWDGISSKAGWFAQMIKDFINNALAAIGLPPIGGGSKSTGTSANATTTGMLTNAATQALAQLSAGPGGSAAPAGAGAGASGRGGLTVGSISVQVTTGPVESDVDVDRMAHRVSDIVINRLARAAA